MLQLKPFFWPIAGAHQRRRRDAAGEADGVRVEPDADALPAVAEPADDGALQQPRRFARRR